MILVLGGTSDSLKICDRLYEIGINDFVLSVVTEFGRDLAESHAKDIINGKMDKKGMVEYIKNNGVRRSEEHTSELQSRQYLVCRLLLEKKKNKIHVKRC